jgi:hypothetical protein
MNAHAGLRACTDRPSRWNNNWRATLLFPIGNDRQAVIVFDHNQERPMVGSPTQKRTGGHRGQDKQQDALRDQDSVRDRGPIDKPKISERGRKAQEEAALRQPPSPGEPAGGE